MRQTKKKFSFPRLGEYKPSPILLSRMNKNDPEEFEYFIGRVKQYIKEGFSVSSQADFLRELGEFHAETLKHSLIGVPNIKDIKLDASRLSRVLNHADKDKINEEDFALACHLLNFRSFYVSGKMDGAIADKYPHALFFALMAFMDIGEFTLENIKSRAPGLYRAYRPSSTFPGNFWIGSMEVSVDPQTGAVLVEEFYQSDGFDNRPNKVVMLDGHLVRKGRHYTILTRNKSEGSLSIALLPAVSIEGDKITGLSGAVLDMSTGRLWGGRVLYEREYPTQEEATKTKDSGMEKLRDRLQKEARVVGPEGVPQSILDFFNFRAIENLTLF